MSIIHDALKKAQEGLTPKSEYIYATPPATEESVEAVEKIPQEKPPIKNKIQSIYTTTCIVLITLAITIASAEYIYQQFQNDIPKVQRLAQKSFDKLIHKKPSLPTMPSYELKPLAQLTINPTNSNGSNSAPLTLNVHGIMANGNRNLALINDQVYQEGDLLDGARIVKINLDSISIINNGKEQTIFVKN